MASLKKTTYSLKNHYIILSDILTDNSDIMDGKCCVCSSDIYTEAAHVKAERDFPLFDNDRMKNLLPLCPTCHKYCDHPINAITLHPD